MRDEILNSDNLLPDSYDNEEWRKQKQNVMNTDKMISVIGLPTFPWKIENEVIKDALGLTLLEPASIDRVTDKQVGNAALVAVNATYGAGINPEAVKEMFQALAHVIYVETGVCTQGERRTAFERAKAAIEKATIK